MNSQFAFYFRDGFPVVVQEGCNLPKNGFGITHRDMAFSDDMRWYTVQPDFIASNLNDCLQQAVAHSTVTFVRNGSPASNYYGARDVVIWFYVKDSTGESYETLKVVLPKLRSGNIELNITLDEIMSQDGWQQLKAHLPECHEQQMTPEAAINLLLHWLLDEPGYPQETHWQGIRQAIATCEALDRSEFIKYTDYDPGDLIWKAKEILEIAMERYSD